MVQELHVVRCFSCENFQTQIVKKTNKWECKVCGVKQSIKKVYGRGSGKECRLHTQKLNAMRGGLEETNAGYCKDGPFVSASVQNKASPSPEPLSSVTDNGTRCTKTSKWAIFVDEKKFDEGDDHSADATGNGQTSVNPQFSGSFDRKKRKHEKSSIMSSQASPSFCSNLNEFCNSPIQSESHQNFNAKRVKNDVKDSLKSVKTNININAGTESDSMTIHFSPVTDRDQSCKKREPRRESLYTNSGGGKWGKYLANVEIYQNSPDSACDNLSSDVVSYTTTDHLNSCSSVKTKSALSNESESQTIHKINSSECNIFSSLNRFKSESFERASFDSKHGDSVIKNENEKSISTLPGKLFDQGCDISDIDLDLNF